MASTLSLTRERRRPVRGALGRVDSGAAQGGLPPVCYDHSKARLRSWAMDRLTSMAVFKRTVELGSFAAVARQFGISPEMVGNHVRALEERMGVRLLNRSTRRLHLTEAGTLYYERCKRILAEIDESEAEANSFHGIAKLTDVGTCAGDRRATASHHAA